MFNNYIIIFALNGQEILLRNKNKNIPSKENKIGVPQKIIIYITTPPRLPTVNILKLSISPREQKN